VDKALQQSSQKENIKSKFGVFRIWPLNIIAMVGKFGTSDVFITTKEEEHENSYHLNAIDESNNNEAKNTIELLNIVGTFQATILTTPSMSNCPSSPMSYYYVEMPHSLATPRNNHEEDQLVVNFENATPNLDNLISLSKIRGPVGLANLLLLLILPTKKRQGNEPLVDYSNSRGYIRLIFNNSKTKGNGQKSC
jgi:hypothetical protein